MAGRRVAIVGGGMAGLTAAWELSRPGPDQAEVTVYQRGWRLGGKGASSRGPNGRIEEHGLHMWLGFYDNAFRLIRDCYDELDRGRTDPSCSIRGFRDAFVPASVIGLGRTAEPEAEIWFARFPENERLPGGPTGGNELTPTSFLERGLTLLGRFGSSLERPVSPSPRAALSVSPRHPVAAGRFSAAGAELFEGARRGLRATAIDPTAARRTAELIELLQTMLRGIALDGLTSRGYTAIDHLDLREWMAGHGASKAALDSPLVGGFYDLSFAYEEGDPSRPRFPAGLALHLALRMFLDYKGAIFWKMRAGMGDVVIAPLYQALRERGVRFRFFHRLDRLELSTDGRRIAAAVFGLQARSRGGEYEPLTRIRELPVFPDRPDPDQLDADAAVAEQDLESHACRWPDAESVRVEAGRDYDALIFAASLGMVPHTCGELLAADERWREMVANVGTVATQAFQAWLGPDELSLGWSQAAATVTGCGGSFETFASMSHALPFEDWPDAEPPLTAASFCAALPEAEIANGRPPGEVVADNAAAFLGRRGSALWPAAVNRDGGFRHDLLRSQYCRANVDPSDRYVQALPGTGRHRLRADASGFENLFLAGDWIDTGLNAGCIEAAVLGGVQAANAVSGRELTAGISGGYRPENGTDG